PSSSPSCPRSSRMSATPSSTRASASAEDPAMATVELVAPPPPLSLLKRLQQPRVLIALVALMWLPLTLYVMFGHYFEEPGRNSLPVRAFRASLLLYFVGVASWGDWRFAVIGARLVFFWLIVAATVPFLPLVDPNKPIAPFAEPGIVKNGHFFLLGA